VPTRYIKENARTSRSLALVSAEAERLFWRLVVSADDFGCFEASTEVLLGTCFPRMLRTVTEAQIAAWLLELASGDDPMLEIYTNSGNVYLHFRNWDRHQKRRAKAPKYPLPTDPDSTCVQMSADADKCEQTQTFVAVFGIGIGFESECVNPPSPPGGAGAADTSPARRTRRPKATDEPYSGDFERFWSAYPRRIAKKAAWRTWQARLGDGVDPEALIAAAERYAKAMLAESRTVDKMLHASTFLGPSARYEDYLPSSDAPPRVPASTPLPPPEPEVTEEQRQRNIAGVQDLQRKYLGRRAPPLESGEGTG